MRAESWHAQKPPSWNDKPQIYRSSLFFFFSCITKRPKCQRRNWQVSSGKKKVSTGKRLNWHFRRRWWLLVQGAKATRAETKVRGQDWSRKAEKGGRTHHNKEDPSRSKGNKEMRNWKHKWVSAESETREWDSREEFTWDGDDFTNKKASTLKAQPFKKKKILNTMPYLTASLLTKIF